MEEPKPSVGQRIRNALLNNLLTILLVTGVVLGIGVGFLIRGTSGPMDPRARDYVAFPGMILIRLLKLSATPLIIACIVVALSSLDLSVSRTLGWQFIVYVIVTKIVSAVLGLVMAIVIHPGRGKSDDTMKSDHTLDDKGTIIDIFLDMFRNIIPGNMVRMYVQQQQTKVIHTENSSSDVFTWDTRISYIDGMNLLGMVFTATLVGLCFTILANRALGFLVAAPDAPDARLGGGGAVAAVCWALQGLSAPAGAAGAARGAEAEGAWQRGRSAPTVRAPCGRVDSGWEAVARGGGGAPLRAPAPAPAHPTAGPADAPPPRSAPHVAADDLRGGVHSEGANLAQRGGGCAQAAGAPAAEAAAGAAGAGRRAEHASLLPWRRPAVPQYLPRSCAVHPMLAEDELANAECCAEASSHPITRPEDARGGGGARSEDARPDDVLVPPAREDASGSAHSLARPDHVLPGGCGGGGDASSEDV